MGFHAVAVLKGFYRTRPKMRISSFFGSINPEIVASG